VSDCESIWKALTVGKVFTDRRQVSYRVRVVNLSLQRFYSIFWRLQLFSQHVNFHLTLLHMLFKQNNNLLQCFYSIHSKFVGIGCHANLSTREEPRQFANRYQGIFHQHGWWKNMSAENYFKQRKNGNFKRNRIQIKGQRKFFGESKLLFPSTTWQHRNNGIAHYCYILMHLNWEVYFWKFVKERLLM